MGIEELIKNGGFSEKECTEIRKLDKALQDNGTPFTYVLDISLSCAKCYSREQKIALTDLSDYPTLIHELLHADLTCIQGYPDNIDLQEHKPINYHGFSDMVLAMSNDVQHFVFYRRFRELTSHLSEVKFIINQNEMCVLSNRPNMRVNIHGLRNIEKSKGIKTQILEFYEGTYAKLYYSKYIDNIDISNHLYELRDAFAKLVSCFETLFQRG